MYNEKAERWIKHRNIEIKESFVTSLTRYVKEYKKNRISNCKDIYALLEISQKNIHKWKNINFSAHTKNNFKYKLVDKASNLFELNNIEKESLANKAGITMEVYRDIFFENNKNINFANHFNNLLNNCSNKISILCDDSLVSERMMGHMRLGNHIRKEAITSVLISMKLKLKDINICLKKAGFILSHSILQDIVVMWLLENNNKCSVYNINLVLEDLQLPLLMTRQKS